MRKTSTFDREAADYSNFSNRRREGPHVLFPRLLAPHPPPPFRFSFDAPPSFSHRQHATGTRGLYRTLLVEQKPMSARNDFQALAEAEEAALPAGERLPSAAEAKADPARYEGVLSARERRFWRSITMQPPLYGADVAGTLWDEPRGGSAASSSAGGGGAPTSVSASSAPAHNTSNPAVDRWNIGRLDSLLSRTLRKHDAEIPGVSTSYLYFGMWRSIFAWHTEDMDLASVRSEDFSSIFFNFDLSLRQGKKENEKNSFSLSSLPHCPPPTHTNTTRSTTSTSAPPSAGTACPRPTALASSASRVASCPTSSASAQSSCATRS